MSSLYNKSLLKVKILDKNPRGWGKIETDKWQIRRGGSKTRRKQKTNENEEEEKMYRRLF